VERYGLGVGSGSVRMRELVDLFVSLEIDVVGVTRCPAPKTPGHRRKIKTPVTDRKLLSLGTGYREHPVQEAENTRHRIPRTPGSGRRDRKLRTPSAGNREHPVREAENSRPWLEL